MRTRGGADPRDGGRASLPAAGAPLRMAGVLRRVAAVASDPGSTNALMPVVRALAASGVEVWVGTSGPAGAAWDRAALPAPATRLPDALPLEEAAETLRGRSPDLVVTGAGGFNRIEHTFRLAARRLGLPGVAVLDERGRYRERFQREGTEGPTDSTPDGICAPDEDTRNEMIAQGYAPAAIHVTGQPHLEAVEGFFASLSPADLRRRRRAAGLGAGERVVAFFSESLAEAREGARPAARPPQLAALASLAKALGDHAGAGTAPLRLMARPHPREDPRPLAEALARLRSPRCRAALVEQGSALDLVAVSDVVAGITSMVLLEALLGGRPVLSVQIGHPIIPRWAAGLMDAVPVATSEEALARMLGGALAGARPAGPPAPRFQGSTEAVIRALEAAVQELARPRGGPAAPAAPAARADRER